MIVVVEDDKALANLIAAVARRCGEAAETFSAADDALARIREAPLSVTMVLADLSTEGHGGDWLCKEISGDEHLRHIRVWILSGDRDVDARAKACGAAGSLRKPFSLTELEGVLRGTSS